MSAPADTSPGGGSAGSDPRTGPPLVQQRARLWMMLGERRRSVALLALCSGLSGVTEAGILALLAQIATRAASGRSQAKLSLVNVHAPTNTLFLIALGLTLVRIGLQVPLSVLPARIAADVQSRLRRELFNVFTRASWSVQSRDREGYLQETMTGQVAQATSGALQATGLVIASFTFLMLMGSALALNPIAAVVILVAAVVLFVLLRPLNVLAVRIARALSAAQVAYAGGVSEAGRLAEETHVFGAGQAQRERLDRLIAQAQKLFFRSSLVMRLTPSIYQSAVYLIIIGGLYVLYHEGAGHLASLGAVVLIVIRAGTFGQAVQLSYQGLRTSLPFIDRLQTTARRYSDSTIPDGTVPLGEVRTMAFQDVYFGYRPARPVLRDLSFEVQAGEAVGIIGPSGAGKSTLIQILLALRTPDLGSYLVNGMPVTDYRSADWHSRVSYVPQQPRLLHASVADNIRFFRDIEDADVERAARLARIHDEVMSWPDGYDTTVGPRMDAVSGGQQQRICLARALAGHPHVLVLDEPTSALDPHSERLIQESLSTLRHELTLFIIAHRMSTLDICDRVMVIVDGRLAAFDTVDLLQKNNSYYQSASLLAASAAEAQP